MILNQISLIDCLVFLICLAPQLVLQVGFFPTAICGLSALPFLVFKMPYQLVRERVFTPYSKRTPLSQNCAWWIDIVLRCVRYAFAYIPAEIGAVFFSKPVALPFLRWRMLRHGYRHSPILFKEIQIPLDSPTDPNNIYSVPTTDEWTRKHRREHTPVRAVYVATDPSAPPDTLVYYLHGGGFAMGSSYFYLEFLIAWAYLLKSRGIARNPAVLALEYTLVPQATYPTQLRQARAGYEEAVRRVANNAAQRICVAGDSAGATLGLSLLLALAKEEDVAQKQLNGASAAQPRPSRRPGFATMISPWCTLISPINCNTPSDYLNAESLHLYARQYLGSKEEVPLPGIVKEQKILEKSNGDVGDQNPWRVSNDHPLASPGKNVDLALWKQATPVHGWHFLYGSEEVFAPETKVLADRLKECGARVEVEEEPAAVHAWPVVNLFLGHEKSERIKGLVRIVDGMGRGKKSQV